jgi:hypothetical protein
MESIIHFLLIDPVNQLVERKTLPRDEVWHAGDRLRALVEVDIFDVAVARCGGQQLHIFFDDNGLAKDPEVYAALLDDEGQVIILPGKLAVFSAETVRMEDGDWEEMPASVSAEREAVIRRRIHWVSAEFAEKKRQQDLMAAKSKWEAIGANVEIIDGMVAIISVPDGGSK